MRQLVEFEHAMEETKGIPGRLPAGERILWQGAPNWRSLAANVFHIRLIALYFAIIAVWRLVEGLQTGAATVELVGSVVMAFLMALAAISILSGIAWLTARSTVYTITNKRVLMRIGIAIQITLNLPFPKITAAAVKIHGGPKGNGNLSIETVGDKRVGWVMLWPHIRPWKFANAQPTFRCVDDIAEGAKVLAEALQTSQAKELAKEGQAIRAINKNAENGSGKGDFGEMVPAE